MTAGGGPDEVQCLNGELLPGTAWCDGYPDCGQGEDETGCPDSAWPGWPLWGQEGDSPVQNTKPNFPPAPDVSLNVSQPECERVVLFIKEIQANFTVSIFSLSDILEP